MKVCRAAVVALVGWFMFLPPTYPDHGADIKAPLPLWFKANHTFSSLSECQKVKQGLVDLHVKPYQNEHEREKAQGEMAAICISSDDPRLKGHYR